MSLSLLCKKDVHRYFLDLLLSLGMSSLLLIIISQLFRSELLLNHALALLFCHPVTDGVFSHELPRVLQLRDLHRLAGLSLVLLAVLFLDLLALFDRRDNLRSFFRDQCRRCIVAISAIIAGKMLLSVFATLRSHSQGL